MDPIHKTIIIQRYCLLIAIFYMNYYEMPFIDFIQMNSFRK